MNVKITEMYKLWEATKCKKDEDVNPINYPIWEMLKPKMAKNQFIHTGENIPEEVKKMVELAYTCGYRRAKKGKPFMYQNCINKEGVNED